MVFLNRGLIILVFPHDDGSGSGPGPGRGPGPGHPAFVKDLSDSVNQIGNILVQIFSTLTDAAGGGLGDPTAILSGLFQQLAQPVSGL
ncbi:hypothetical protein AVEN_144681-1 [Araneus ventricosus]|uniref:Uncharacterized protein n=1 Tax=Araneus ventricosus TaxID=182803 RepID=A0A4Y2QCS6_ARAVE|nr:hypothetical protein AVEN_144681-1 [Araneus ventricosus]